MENVAKLNDMIEIYRYNALTPSNIQPEMEMLHYYACKCDHITEFGFGRGKSSSAFIAAKADKVISYDIIDRWSIAQKWKELAAKINVEFVYIQKSSLEIEIEPTDLLFIDSWHTYDQKKAELTLHADKVRKYIIIHDTKTCANIGEDGSVPGYTQAIYEFLNTNKNWRIKESSVAHNGYTVMERIS